MEALTMNLALQMKTPRTQTPKQIVIEWIEHILDRKNLSGTELARKAELAPSTLLRLLNDPEHPFLPSQKTLRKIAQASGIPITKKVLESIGGEDEDNPVDMGEPRRSARAGAQARPATVEFRHVSALPAALQASASARRDGFVPAPPQVNGDDTAFAFHMPDNSLDPWIKAGSLMFATKRRDPIAQDLVMVTTKDGKTRVRFMSSIDEKGVKITKNPLARDDETVKFDDIQDIATVMIVMRTV
jgi:transcriptional regulator with XRE-family HTH domain